MCCLFMVQYVYGPEPVLVWQTLREFSVLFALHYGFNCLERTMSGMYQLMLLESLFWGFCLIQHQDLRADYNVGA